MMSMEKAPAAMEVESFRLTTADLTALLAKAVEAGRQRPTAESIVIAKMLVDQTRGRW